MKHPVVWFEINGEDANALHGFYGELFGWKIAADNPMNYGMVEAEKGRGIPGGIGKKDENNPGVTFYVSTTSIDDSLKAAEKLGAKTLMPRTQLPGGTILAFFADPDGNAVGLVEEAA
ncbi:MAG: VOC family protein [Deltaproteobacteria bacterium]